MNSSSILAEAQRLFAQGSTAWSEGRLDDAAQCFAGAVRLAPGYGAAHTNLGAILRRQGRPEAAMACHRRALSVEPDNAATWSNLGNTLRDLGRFEEAEKALGRALDLEPANRGFQYNMALILRDHRKHRDAESMLAALAASEPDNAEYVWDLALSRLYLGDYVRGFEGYESRLFLARNPARDFPGTRWTGGAVAGKRVLLASEQGFGDALQFVRYVPLLAARGASIVLECLPELMELFSGLPGVVALFPKGAPAPDYDLWAPLASLPHLMGTTFDAIPAQVPYLKAPNRPGLRLARPKGGLAVGVVWAGKTTPRDRSWPLEKLTPLFTNPLIAFYSLQLGPRAADLGRLGLSHLLVDAQPALTSFADTAAVMAHLDLIITVDTSVGHLAGALGRPVWELLRYVSDWRWQDEPETSPWYPTMRLFRQEHPEDFDGPVGRMAGALEALVGNIGGGAG